ncbi:hypothetical protein, partial [Pseudomonas aeruginosa]|uniref:hypothetical protein n=1 Tax=Pseudomonas aeruginosa TaxID=287 RepID=UPI0031367E4F
GRVHLAFLCFTHLLSSFRGRQLKLPRSHCLKRWIHYKMQILVIEAMKEGADPEALLSSAQKVIDERTKELDKLD